MQVSKRVNFLSKIPDVYFTARIDATFINQLRQKSHIFLRLLPELVGKTCSA
jgi:hypothetical protein